MTASQQAYDYKRAWNYALWLLGRQMLSEKQVRDKLRRKLVEAADIDKIIQQLYSLNYLNDQLYAESFQRSRSRKKGSLAIRQELKQRGIAEAIIEESLEQRTPEQETQTAQAILAKQAWRFQKDDKHKNYRKAYAFLARRGFSSDIIKAALEDFFS